MALGLSKRGALLVLVGLVGAIGACARAVEGTDSDGGRDGGRNDLGSGPCQMGALDDPDDAFRDANCDGIDGDVTRAIFVDGLGGSDDNPGTKDKPLKSIGAGIKKAAAASPRKQVYISAAT